MPLININADLSTATEWLKRIALALERAYPPFEKPKVSKRGLEALSHVTDTSTPLDESWRTYGPRSNYTRELPLPNEPEE